MLLPAHACEYFRVESLNQSVTDTVCEHRSNAGAAVYTARRHGRPFQGWTALQAVSETAATALNWLAVPAIHVH
jgi:hypothetical protein